VWRRDRFRPDRAPNGEGPPVVLWADTFSTYFEPEIARAAAAVLAAAGYRVIAPQPPNGGRPLCCGRTFLATGLIEQARAELRRVVAALAPHAATGVPIVGLEPSCLLTLRDELGAVLPGDDAKSVGASAVLFHEFLLREHVAGKLRLPLEPLPEKRALLHGHCHEKAFGLLPALADVLRFVPDLDVAVVETSCCGMAGAFGYGADHYRTSMDMAELNLLPAIRRCSPDTLIVADGTSCRRQILDGAGRRAQHAAEVLARALAS
jgi:Fe-S oxidoreductase